MAASRAFLALGSNLGPRERALESALRRLAESGLRLGARSSLYLTEPVGGPPQGWFLNQVVCGDTSHSPEELLERCLAIEGELGRRREVRNGPRSIDIDLLLFADTVRQSERLTLPHPRLHERRFVLVPLAEIAPEVRHPLLGLTARELLLRCADPCRVLWHAPAVA